MKRQECQPVVLVIMDGFGHCVGDTCGAMARANLPHLDEYRQKYPFTVIGASGEDVGLPEGQMGNSEVGHLNIGAGRIVYQDLTRIDKSIRDGDFFTNGVLLQAIENARQNKSGLHLMGLLSDGGVHSHIRQLCALIDLAEKQGLREKIYIHAILDGRDVPPSSAEKYFVELAEYLGDKGIGQVASVSGRYYPMDRDNRWDRVAKAYNVYVYGQGLVALDPFTAVKEAYRRGETDEFIMPTAISSGGEPAVIKDHDSLIMFNFRSDRMRQITRAFLDHELGQMERGDKPVFPFVVTMTEYDHTFRSPIAYPAEYLHNTLGEWVSRHGCRQLRLTETEKYAHLTFFFNGGREEPFSDEERVLIPSPQVATYDLKPEMSAPEIARRACAEIKSSRYALIILNFANADMVGHTGVMEAAVKAVETVDREVGKIVKTALACNVRVILTADHGNAEKMVDDGTGKPHTAHTVSPVPLILVDGSSCYQLRDGGRLADIAPTVLELMGLPTPEEMTGKSMLVST